MSRIDDSGFFRYEAINYTVRPGHVAKPSLLTALIEVGFIGLKHLSCKKLANSDWVFFS